MKTSFKAALAAIVLALPVAAAAQQHQHGRPPAAGQPGQGQGQGMQHQHMMQGHGMHQGGSGGGAHAMSATPKGDSSPSSLAFHGINNKMHEGMDITYTGNADVDFVRGMIPHHQGAVDMAKTVMAFGKDPEIRKLAEAIVKAQEDEIAQLKAWLAKNAK